VIDEKLQLLERSGRYLGRIPCRRTRELFECVAADLLQGVDPRERLGLSGCEGQAVRLARRNFYLLQALRLIQGDSRRARLMGLQKEITRFLSIIWPQWRELSEPPAETSELRSCLFFARRAGVLPGSYRQLVNIANCEIKPIQISHDSSETSIAPEIE